MKSDLFEPSDGAYAELTRWKVLGLAALAGVNCVLVNNALQADWQLFAMPGPSFDAMIATEPLVARLESLSAVWEYELTLCTFVVTFSLNQAAMRLASKDWRDQSNMQQTGMDTVMADVGQAATKAPMWQPGGRGTPASG